MGTLFRQTPNNGYPFPPKWPLKMGTGLAASAAHPRPNNIWVPPPPPPGGFLLRNSIELILRTWKKLMLTCFTKMIAEQSGCHPICVINVSYEREIIVLSLPVISFVIRIVVFQRFDIKSGFPFYWLTLYTFGGMFEARIDVNSNLIMHTQKCI